MEKINLVQRIGIVLANLVGTTFMGTTLYRENISFGGQKIK